MSKTEMVRRPARWAIWVASWAVVDEPVDIAAFNYAVPVLGVE